MTHTTIQFEIQLLQMNVEIESIHKRGQFVHYAIGFINGVRHKWDAFGSCFCGQLREPQYDLKFISISSDQNTISFGPEKHVFTPKTIFTRKRVCAICSLKSACGKEPWDETLFPCMPAARIDKRNGFFKTKKA